MADKKQVKSYEAKCPKEECGHLVKKDYCVNCERKDTLTLVKDADGTMKSLKCSNGHNYSDMKCNKCNTKIYWQHFIIDGAPVTPPKPKPNPFKKVEDLFVTIIVVLFLLVLLGMC